MKQTASAPPAILPAKPEVTQAVREANGAGSSQNGNPPDSPNGLSSRFPSRLARVREISLGLKLLALGVAVVLVISTSGGGWYWFHSLTTNRPPTLDALICGAYMEKPDAGSTRNVPGVSARRR